MRAYVLLTFITFSLYSDAAFSQSDNGYALSTTIIEHADLVGDYEIDTGKFVILKYRSSFDIPGVIDEEHETFIFIKLTSIENLLLNKSYSLPDPAISVCTYFQSPWSYRETDKITGTITRIKSLDNIQEFNLHLQFVNKKGETDTLLYGIYQFKRDENYFVDNIQDYNGFYDNLRIALKEPLKVRGLDLSYGGVWKYQKNLSGKQELPREIAKFKNLEEFNLQLQDLKSLRPEFEQLVNLKVLDISYNYFETFPTEIFSCQNLDSLYLQLSQIKEIPIEISRLKKLKKLVLDYNRFSGFPIAVTNLPDLKELSIENGKVQSIPKEIGKLSKLEKLNLGNFWNYDRKNRCDSLHYVSQLPNLKELNLEWTKIRSLPSEFSQLKRLEVLNIKCNDFKSFPEVIDRIPNLKLLIICHEEFNSKTMRKLKKQDKKYKVQVDTL